MIVDWQRKYSTYQIEGVLSNFSDVPDGMKVSTCPFYTVFEPYENRWGTMVTLQTPMNSAVRETSWLTSSRFLYWQTSPQGNTKYLQQ